MRDYMGKEHFPSCPCFEQSDDVADELYQIAQEHANSLVATLVQQGFCKVSMPYAVALFTNMCVSMIASNTTSQVMPKVNKESLAAFSAEQHALLDKVRERQDALMRRADAITFADQGGSTSVQ